MFIRAVSRLGAVALALVTSPASYPVGAAEPAVWTLESAVRRGVAVAAEMRAIESEVRAREGELQRDGAWPMPTVELRADRRLGIETGRGGTDVTQLAITQPLPVSRLAHQRARAEANVAAARFGRLHVRLQLEHRTARAFHAVQLAEAKYRLAEQRFAAGRRYAETRTDTGALDRLVRYLTPLDRTRLAILGETARQALAAADGERREAELRLRFELALPTEPIRLAVLADAAPLPAADPDRSLEDHPVLVSARFELEAARRGIDVARASRLADPTVSVFRERDVFGDAERGYYGIAVGVQVPLWHANQGEVARAAAETNRAEALYAERRRELEAARRGSRLRLERFIAQARDYVPNVLGPSERLLALTRRSFAAGEVGVLTLLDANNGYFDAAERRLELLAESWFAAADLRLATNQTLIGEHEQ